MATLPSFDLVLFGGTGDLATRKLLPALYRRYLAGQLDAKSRVIGSARSALARDAYQKLVTESCKSHTGSDFDTAKCEAFVQLVYYAKADAAVDNDFEAFSELLKGREENVRVFFMSTAPSLFMTICDQLARHSLATPHSRVVLEKPLGLSLESSDEINRCVSRVFAEKQIYRIDHYLGKEGVQNLMALRFGNMLFEPLWRRGRISHVQITVAEQLGVEGRGPFYDGTGALRDMVQNHLLQLLCILAMEPPTSDDPDAIRDEKLKVLRALQPLTPEDVAEKTVRGQYKSGTALGTKVPGYLEEQGVPADSATETFVALRAEINNWRWAGVPFYLRTGKRLQEKLAEIVVTFEDVPYFIFEHSGKSTSQNSLVIRLQPEESITLSILAKNPGEGMRLKPVKLSLDFGDVFKARALDAYERLLMDVVKGNLTLFMRRDELDAAWRWIDPIRAAWDHEGDRPKSYAAGTWGPAASNALIARDGHSWQDEL
jgi:glucose-6-phosphate 1-dehydrogenase